MVKISTWRKGKGKSRHWLIREFLTCVSGPDIPGFLLQPFRKPKRIRTAFSPSQLLKLEHAFEKNHYVVGAERKQLAQALSLTETQVTSSTYSQGSTLYARCLYPLSDSIDLILIRWSFSKRYWYLVTF